MTTLVLVTPVVWEHYFVLLYLPWLAALSRSSRRVLPPLIVAYFLVAAAILVYHTPPGLQALAQLAPIAGSLLLLGVQIQQSIQPAAAEAGAAQGR
jgi:hypothetical protein